MSASLALLHQAGPTSFGVVRSETRAKARSRSAVAAHQQALTSKNAAVGQIPSADSILDAIHEQQARRFE